MKSILFLRTKLSLLQSPIECFSVPVFCLRDQYNYLRLPACEYSIHRLLEMGSGKGRLKRMSTESMIKGTETLVCLTSFSIQAWMLYLLLSEATWERVMGENDMDLSWG